MEYEVLLNVRRSIRSYKENMTVRKETIEEMIGAAQKAASWKNSQTARYYVALSEEAIQAVRAALPGFNQNSTVNACAYIITAFETKRAGFDREGNPDNELGDEWGAYDLGLANENMILKACELGLDTLIMGLRDADALRAYFGIPASQQVAAVISVGYRTADPAMPKRKPLEDVAVFK